MPFIWVNWKHAAVQEEFFMSTDTTFPLNNDMIHNIAQLIKHIMLAVAEAELGVLYIYSKHAMQMWHTIIAVGYLQPSTPMQTENSTAYGVVWNKIIPKATKVMDMCFHWLQDCEQQQHFCFYLQLDKPTM